MEFSPTDTTPPRRRGRPYIIRNDPPTTPGSPPSASPDPPGDEWDFMLSNPPDDVYSALSSPGDPEIPLSSFISPCDPATAPDPESKSESPPATTNRAAAVVPDSDMAREQSKEPQRREKKKADHVRKKSTDPEGDQSEENAVRMLLRRIIARQNYCQMQRRQQYLLMEKIRIREERAEKVLAERRAAFFRRVEQSRRIEEIIRQYR
jgi:hypothetical protein